MSRFLDRPGLFKATPIEWGVHRLPSGDPIIRVFFECFAVFENEEWRDIDAANVRGDFFLVKKTGAPNEKVVEMLCALLGWSGVLADVHGQPPMTAAVQLEVEGNEYKGKTYYQARWIREGDAAPRSGAGGVSPEEAHALDAQHGDKFTALAKKFAKAKPVADYGDIPF